MLVNQPWPLQAYSWPRAIMKIDSSLVVDGKEMIVRGDDMKFDPRSVWHGRVTTTPTSTTPDNSGKFPPHADYGIENPSFGVVKTRMPAR